MFWHKGHSPITVSATKINQLNFCPQFAIYRNITTPSLSYAHEHCRNPKEVSQKVATLEKTTFLYWSKSLISLWSRHLTSCRENIVCHSNGGFFWDIWPVLGTHHFFYIAPLRCVPLFKSLHHRTTVSFFQQNFSRHHISATAALHHLILAPYFRGKKFAPSKICIT